MQPNRGEKQDAIEGKTQIHETEYFKLVQIVGRTLQSKTLLDEGKSTEDVANEQTALFDVVVDYTYALDTLHNYDYNRLTVENTTPEERFHATYENVIQTINALHLPNIRWQRPLPEYRGESGDVIVSCDQKSLLF